MFSTTTRFCDIKKKNTKLLVAFLYDDDNKVSHPLVRSLVRSRSRFFNDFIIGVKSYMRVSNVPLDIWVVTISFSSSPS